MRRRCAVDATARTIDADDDVKLSAPRGSRSLKSDKRRLPSHLPSLGDREREKRGGNDVAAALLCSKLNRWRLVNAKAQVAFEDKRQRSIKALDCLKERIFALEEDLGAREIELIDALSKRNVLFAQRDMQFALGEKMEAALDAMSTTIVEILAALEESVGGIRFSCANGNATADQCAAAVSGELRKLADAANRALPLNQNTVDDVTRAALSLGRIKKTLASTAQLIAHCKTIASRVVPHPHHHAE